jgi:hypothetical protein
MFDPAPVVECVVAMRSAEFTSIAGCIQRSARDLIKRKNARREAELYLQRQVCIFREFTDNPLAQQDKDDAIAWKGYFVGRPLEQVVDSNVNAIRINKQDSTRLIRQNIVSSIESDPIDLIADACKESDRLAALT